MKQQWCLASVGADFVWRMEDVLQFAAQPYDAQHPVVCIDERPCQLLKDKQAPLPAQPGQLQRYDYHYERNGTCNLFVAFQPLQGWRAVEVTERRTSIDFAYWLKRLVDECFAGATLIWVVLDNLNIHTLACLYQAFPADEAQRISQRLEFHYTPKNGSWLNMVVELSVLVRQCMKERIANPEAFKYQIQLWQHQRNQQRATVQWQFTTQDARVKLQRLYASIDPA